MNKQKLNIQELLEQFPLIEKLQTEQYVFWENEKLTAEKLENKSITMEMIRDAEKRLQRFSSYIQVAFPITKFS